MTKKYLVLVCILISSAFAKAQSSNIDTTIIKRKSYKATRVTTEPEIDGKPFEDFWANIPAGGNFRMIEPTSGLPERETHKTEFKVAYDDDALYVAGYMYDSNPSQIARQFSQRDEVFAQADLFGFFINTYNNQINQTRFYATSANSLGDSVAENGRDDFSFNVVFRSEATIDENGWYVEMRIPYRTLRFNEAPVQDWSFQVYRQIRHLNEEYSYNYIDRTRGSSSQYDALLTGIKNINPPLRLNLYPFAQGSYTTFDGTTTSNISAGMDLKYGINEAFTLDATLIPDFGQVAFDQVRLNLGPFEQTFGENRAFFTEGTDLFNKGGLFFSRRIGQSPTGSGRIELFADEDIIDNPDASKLLNAVKVTGRNRNGLGIGFLNAITERTEATVENSLSGERRNVLTEPLTNYNVFVLDQQYGSNSSVSFVNASTLRDGSFTDANVTALVVDHNDRDLTYNYGAELKMSNRFTPDGTVTGYNTELDWRKTSGSWRPRLSHDFVSEDWNPNDLGRNFRTNFQQFGGEIEYNQFVPTGIFNSYSVELGASHRRSADPDFHINSGARINARFRTRERNAFGVDANVNTRNLDRFESRIDGLNVRYAASQSFGGFISTDYRKKFAVDVRANYFYLFSDPEKGYSYNIAPRYRFSDKFLLVYRFNWNKNDQRISYVARTNDRTTSILSRRDTHSVENQLSGTYNFDNKQALSLSFRNFWSRARFSRDFEELQDDGTTTDSDFELAENSNPDANFNVWNLDLSYRWRFAPGSEATLLYRNSIFNFDNQGSIEFNDSLNDLFMEPVRHNVSLRISYFLDVNDAKSWFRSA
ncbi:DUF5916 domain-containing protein [Nonlabens marinus]|uniref:Uncharacterized protein n=1 Tax=Nonlabens marinus S1-08 TaxID=1454201 RepID=W8W0L0_9FLAO|nr:DUF5916 domain-containing protein [Nonlabens marinus]BAO56511.1 hypothetical protein NMS_2502 [Nonlabens marinus S1-08]